MDVIVRKFDRLESKLGWNNSVPNGILTGALVKLHEEIDRTEKVREEEANTEAKCITSDTQMALSIKLSGF